MYDLSGSRILITGGAGFVGSHIIDQLLQRGVEEIVVLDNMLRGRPGNIAEPLQSGRVTLIEGDIRDLPLVERLVASTDYCLHMAATRITRCAEHPREALEVMFDGAFNVFNACAEHKTRKIVAASSASIYGMADEFPTSERAHPYNNITMYGAGKLANEGMLRAFYHTHQLNYAAMRFFNVYGPRMDTHGRYTEVLIRWYHLIRDGKAPLIFGDGSQTMDFVHVSDVARACIQALAHEATDEVFNVACGVETSLVDLCQTLLDVMGSEIQPEFRPLPSERKAVEVLRRLADTRKAKALIDFEAAIDLRAGLVDLVAWLDQLPEQD